MNKYSTPRKRILTAKEGSIFWIKGERFVVGEFGENIFLTSNNQNHNSSYYWIHLREKATHKAAMGRKVMYDLLMKRMYVIS
jgi:hypothetical protein